MTTFKELWGVDPTPAMKADKNYKEGTIPVAAPDLVVGLELEIENWRGENAYFGYSFKEDNSLRGSAIEAVTLPTKTRYVETLLRGFFEKNKITDANYSERCGTHVHMDISKMTPDQLSTFCLLYQVHERLMFGYVGGDRDKNIFCVPWEQAGINFDLLNTMRTRTKDVSRNWRKYAALNLVPITTFGSVEFRHLPGTCDVDYLMGWINLIGSMYNYAMNNGYKETQQKVIDLNTSSAYDKFVNDVFGKYANLFQANNLQEEMESGVINVKLMSISDLKPEKPVKEKSNLDRLAELNRQVIRDNAELGNGVGRVQAVAPLGEQRIGGWQVRDWPEAVQVQPQIIPPNREEIDRLIRLQQDEIRRRTEEMRAAQRAGIPAAQIRPLNRPR